MWKNWLPLKDRIDEMLPAPLEKSGKSQGIWSGMESGHPDHIGIGKLFATRVPALLGLGRDWRASTTCYHATFGHSRSKGTSLIVNVFQMKIDFATHHFQVLQGHRNQHGSVCYLWHPVSDP